MNDDMSKPLCFTPVPDLPEVFPGDDLVVLLDIALAGGGLSLEHGDVVIVSQKIVSKAENRYRSLADVEPSTRARRIASQCTKDPRMVELVLRESLEVVRIDPGVLITRHRLGFVMANAGIDCSNIPGDEERLLLLPLDPDHSAEAMRQEIARRLGIDVAVLIADSFGRPWRIGVCGVCIGCAGLAAVLDLRGARDRSGRVLEVTQIAVADQLCATGTLVAGEAAEGSPMVIARGVAPACFEHARPAADLVRPLVEDLFR